MAKDDRPNRQALIDATLAAIVEVGLSRTSVSEIITRAGLSRGMIHLHFGGKGALIVAAARHESETYYAGIERMMAAAPPDPAFQLAAYLDHDLGPVGLNRRAVAIWYELRGAARTDPEIATYSDTRDGRLRDMIHALLSRIARDEGKPDPDTFANEATIGLVSLLEGIWADFMLHPDNFDRALVRRVTYRFVSGLLPHSFDLTGPRSR